MSSELTIEKVREYLPKMCSLANAEFGIDIRAIPRGVSDGGDITKGLQLETAHSELEVRVLL